MHTDIEILHARIDRIESLLQQILDSRKKESQQLLSTQEAADFLNLSRARIYQLIYQKTIQPLQKLKRGRILFEVNELNRYLQKRENNLPTK